MGTVNTWLSTRKWWKQGCVECCHDWDIELPELITAGRWPIMSQHGIVATRGSEHWRCSWKLEEVSTDFLKKCDVVVIHVGSCDFPVRNTREMEENYTNYVELLNSISNACPQANILLSSVLPRSGEGKNRVNSQIRSFNQRLNELSQSEQQIDYIENVMHFTDESGVISALFSSRDVTGIHLNEDGKMRLASNIHDALKGICTRERSRLDVDYTLKWLKILNLYLSMLEVWKMKGNEMLSFIG